MASNPILIVDDNPANLKVARFALEGEGYEVRTAGDGEEMARMLREFSPRLILMDIQLPGVDGIELTRRLKADPATRNILIVAVTAYAMKGDRESALSAGCDGYITKPIDPILLPEQVGELLGLSAPAPSVVPTGAVEKESSGLEAAPIAPNAGRLILVVEDNPATRKMFRVTLETAGHEVIEVADCRAALDQVARRRPDLIVQDLILPDMDGMDLARGFRKILAGAPVPIICVSGFLSRLDEARAMEGGFAQVLVKPVDPFHLLDIVSTHLALPFAAANQVGNGRLVLVVDDDVLQRKLAQVWFSNAGFNVLVAADGQAALDIARREHPVAIVSDILMPGMDGYSLCLAARSDPELAGIPVILSSSSYVEEGDRELARRVGAAAMLSKENLEAVVRAVASALALPQQPLPGEAIEALEKEHSHRAFLQLERKVQQNAGLTQRCSLQEAQLAILAGVAEALTRNEVVGEVLGDVLASCLDMAGISKGALYLSESSRLVLKHQIGFSDAEVVRLHNVFGHEVALKDLANRGKVVFIPSPEFPRDFAQDLMMSAGATSLLLVPVNWSTTTYGLMVLGARTADIAGEEAMAFARVLGAQMGQAIGLATAFRSLSASEKRYRTLTENANDAIAVLTPDGRIHEVNRRFSEIAGQPAEQLVGRQLADIATESIEKNAGGRNATFAMRNAEGRVSTVEFSRTPVNVDGQMLIFAIGRDATDQIQAQAQLMASDRMASVGTLAAGVAHEINNPLAAVVANLDFALKTLASITADGSTPAPLAELNESVRDAHEAAAKVCQIAKDLRIFSRAEEDNRGATDTRQVLESTLRVAWNEIRHRARLTVNFGDVPAVEANESRLGQVFLNLVVNAAQAIPEGDADNNEIRVTTGSDPFGRVVVEIRDTGAGMSEETMKKLFTPFFTTKPVGVGTGLGLMICQRIIGDLRGEITVESQVGVGTTFRVVLPAAKGRRQKEAGPVALSLDATRRGRVLLVDDDQMIGAVVRRALSKEHDVTVFESGIDALRFIESGERFDVILSDMMMPVMTGMDFYLQLSQIQPDQAARVVFLSGGAFTTRAREFLDEVPNLHIEKPFDFQYLRALINDRLG